MGDYETILLLLITEVVNKINYLCCKYEWRKLDKQKGKIFVQTTLAQSFLPIRCWSRGHILLPSCFFYHDH